MSPIRKKSRLFEGLQIEKNARMELLEACSEGSAERVQALLETRMFDLTVINKDIQKAPLYAVISNYLNDEKTSGHKKVFELLLKNGANPCLPDHSGFTIAARIFREKKPLIDILLDYMTDVTKQLVCSGMTALHLAVESCSESIVRKILEKNADVNITTIYGLTVLHIAVLNQRLDLMDVLFAYGASVNRSTLGGMQPLHFAKCADMVRKLVKNGAVMNARCSILGDTPLSYAVRNKRSSEVISALLDCGANYAIYDHTGLTPFDYIKRDMVMGKKLLTYGKIAEVFIQHVRSKVPADVKDELTESIRSFGQELDKVKTAKMGDSTVTFWRMMNANAREAANYFRNEEISAAMISHKFELFRCPLMNAFLAGVDRKWSEDIARKALYEIFHGIFPTNIINSIISYLPTKELRILETNSSQ